MRAWLYYRLSRDEDQEMNSLQNQRQILVDYAEQNGHEIVGESFDDNVSGMTFERKGLADLENAVDDELIDVVLVKDLSRLGRHRTQTELFIDHLRQNRVKVISVTENIDTDNENDDLLIGFKQIFNDFYAKDISRKVRAGVRQKQKAGLVANLPMGYYKDKNTNEVKIDEEAADIVREVYDLYLSGYGFSTIARTMNERGIKSPEYYSQRRSGKQFAETSKRFLWVQTTVKRLLTNEIYTGTLINHKTVTSKIRKTKTAVPEDEQYRHEDFLPPIIDKQKWEQAQILLENHQRCSARASSSKAIHRYSGMIKCAQCGASLIAKIRRYNGEEYIEYSCNTYNRYGKKYCTPHRIRESQLDEIITDEISVWRRRIIAKSDKYERIVREWERKRPLYDQKIQMYNDRILILKNQIEEILMERIEDKEHADVYNSMIAKRESQITELQQKIEDCRIYNEISNRKQEHLKSMADMLEDILDSGVLSDTQLRMLVHKIKVSQREDKSLDIELELNGNFDTTVSVFLDPNDDSEPLDIPEFDYSDIDIDALEREVQEELAARAKYGEDPSYF